MTACAPVLALFAAVVRTTSCARELRGLVLMAEGATPASEVVAVLMHATRKDNIVAHGVTNERGRFTLKLPPLLKANLRLLRIGFEPMEASAFSREKGEVSDATFTLHENRIRPATFDAKASSRCRLQPTGAQLVTQLFQQACTAVIASTAPLSGTATARSVAYDRQQNRRGKLLIPLVRSQTVGETARPRVSIGIDSLDKFGYVVVDGPDFNYFAPDADVLLSDLFLARKPNSLMRSSD